jgi:hypothetical protein
MTASTIRENKIVTETISTLQNAMMVTTGNRNNPIILFNKKIIKI